MSLSFSDSPAFSLPHLSFVIPHRIYLWGFTNPSHGLSTPFSLPSSPLGALAEPLLFSHLSPPVRDGPIYPTHSRRPPPRPHPPTGQGGGHISSPGTFSPSLSLAPAQSLSMQIPGEGGGPFAWPLPPTSCPGGRVGVSVVGLVSHGDTQRDKLQWSQLQLPLPPPPGPQPLGDSGG